MRAASVTLGNRGLDGVSDWWHSRGSRAYCPITGQMEDAMFPVFALLGLSLIALTLLGSMFYGAVVSDSASVSDRTMGIVARGRARALATAITLVAFLALYAALASRLAGEIAAEHQWASPLSTGAQRFASWSAWVADLIYPYGAVSPNDHPGAFLIVVILAAAMLGALVLFIAPQAKDERGTVSLGSGARLAAGSVIRYWMATCAAAAFLAAGPAPLWLAAIVATSGALLIGVLYGSLSKGGSVRVLASKLLRLVFRGFRETLHLAVVATMLILRLPQDVVRGVRGVMETVFNTWTTKLDDAAGDVHAVPAWMIRDANDSAEQQLESDGLKRRAAKYPGSIKQSETQQKVDA